LDRVALSRALVSDAAQVLGFVAEHERRVDGLLDFAGAVGGAEDTGEIGALAGRAVGGEIVTDMGLEVGRVTWLAVYVEHHGTSVSADIDEPAQEARAIDVHGPAGDLARHSAEPVIQAQLTPSFPDDERHSDEGQGHKHAHASSFGKRSEPLERRVDTSRSRYRLLP